MEDMEIVDSHQHFWNYAPETHGWIDASMSEIQRDFLPGHLEPILKENNIHGTIAIQADQSISETRFLLDQAAQHDFILGVVGWVNLQCEFLETQLDSLAHHEKLVGFRHIVQDEQDPLFMLKPEFRRGLEIIFERGYTYDLLIYPHQLLAALELIEYFPHAPIVIDHLAKPYIKANYHKGWTHLMKEIGQYPHVFCKWSGMVTEASWEAWEKDDFEPYLDVTSEVFTPGRLMFGSDWPVLNVAASYEQVINIVKDYTAGWPEKDQKKVLAGNARRFYLNNQKN